MEQTQPKPKPKAKPIRRKLEAMVGLPLAKFFGNQELKKSRLDGPKQVFLPSCRIPLNYYEREAVTVTEDASNDPNDDPPTVLILHGLSGNVHEVTSLVHLLEIPDTVRVLVPEAIGHGQDLKRAFAEGARFKQPTPESLVDSTLEFLDVVKAGSNVNAFGASLGGAMLYYIRVKKPSAVRKVALYSPALPYVLADSFLNGLRDGTHEFLNYHNRDDVKDIFRTFLWLDPTESQKRRRKDPLPKFFYEVIYQIYQRDVPEGHYKALQDSLLLGANYNPAETEATTENHSDESKTTSMFVASTDQDSNCSRMVVWAEDDQICNAEKGRRFFGPSARTIFETLPSCGHAFDANGTGIYQVIAPMLKDFLLDFSSSPSS